MRWQPALLVLFLAACGGGNVPEEAAPIDAACSVPSQQAALGSYMEQNYFWYANLATPNAAAPTMAEYFNSMLYSPTDRYSFSEPTVTFDQRFTIGVRVGYGYTLVWDDAQPRRLRVRSVEPAGPAAAQGLARGQTILSIDGLTPEHVAAGLVRAVSEPGVERRIVVRDPQGSVRTLDLVSAEFPLSIVQRPATFTVAKPDGSTSRVGYLAYHSFAGFANVVLHSHVQSLVDAGVDQLVLDLRYNGGGSVLVSRDLASMIGAERTVNRLYTYLRFNSKNLRNNQSVGFASLSEAPVLRNLERLVVITSGGTASASELVINGLKPLMPVMLVGGTTYGKPYGSIVRSSCGTTYHAIQFTTLNSEGLADYANGFTPDCEVPDDLDHALGDPQERRLAAALHVARTGQCPALPAQALTKGPRVRQPVFGEANPPGMFAD